MTQMIGRYMSHVQWHAEDATFKCIGCGASVRAQRLEEAHITPGEFTRRHSVCKRLLTQLQRDELLKTAPAN